MLVENPFLCQSHFFDTCDGISTRKNSLMFDGIFLLDNLTIVDGIPALNELKSLIQAGTLIDLLAPKDC